MINLGFVFLLTLATATPGSSRHHHRAAPEAAPQSVAPANPPAAASDGKWWPDSVKAGPAKIDLATQATLDLPASLLSLGPADAKAFMERNGNRAGDNLAGVLLPKDKDNGKFFVVIRWDAAGYVKDDEADKLDAGQILESIKEGTAQANEWRKQKGFKPVNVVGWDEPPRYDKALHHVVWAIRGSSEEGDSVNFNTRLLGRAGYLSLNLICAPEQLAQLKPTMQDLLGRTTFNADKRYADFKPGKDKVSELGLAALILGGAAVAGKTVLKVGLLAKFSKVFLGIFLAMKKAIILLIAAIGAFVRKLFGKKDQT